MAIPMTDAVEAFATIATFAIGLVVLFAFWLATQGRDISGFVQTVSDLAVPFTIVLILLFVVLSILTEL
jgi:hypothetical protein